MEKDLESWLLYQQLEEQIPNAKSSNLPLNDQGMQNSSFPCSIPCTVAASKNGPLPTFGSSRLPSVKPGQMKEPHGWFYCLPRSRQGLVPDMISHDKSILESDLPAKVPAPVYKNLGKANAPTIGTERSSKQFLVFDQSGSKTTMMFSCGLSSSIPWPTPWSRKPTCFFDCKEGELGNGSDGIYSGANLTDDLGDDHGTDEGSHMCEDSEEINALLYSDEEDGYGDDGEESSTGHSPCLMSQDSFEEGMDEVTSSAGPVKRQKLSEGDYQVPLVTYTTSCVKRNRSLDTEEDAESSCAGSKLGQLNNNGSSLGNKRMRWKKIRETVTILQTILPNRKGSDAVTVLDEAINYLKTLKFKAESLGLSECTD
ncbi:hypothetical protein vseg_019200 [Gypsophila vaccaria]